MANPNLLSLVSVKTDTVIFPVTDTMSDLISSVASDTAINVEAIFCANVHASVAGWITIVLKRSGTEYILVNQQRIAIKTTINAILGKPIYLKESDSLRVQANASSNIVCMAPIATMSAV